MKECVPPKYEPAGKRDYALTMLTMGGWGLWRQEEWWRKVREHSACVDERYRTLTKEEEAELVKSFLKKK